MSHGTLPDGCWYEPQDFVYGTRTGDAVIPRTDSLYYPAHSLWRCRGCGVVRASFKPITVKLDSEGLPYCNIGDIL